MIMPMTVSNESMFPPSTFTYDERSDECFESWGVRPRPHWITTEYGGYVSGVSEFQFAGMNHKWKQLLVRIKCSSGASLHIFLQKIDKVLKRFGSNIIFSNGMRDPWSRGG